MVVDGTVLVATIGATVAAATGVTVLKMGFCIGQTNSNLSHVLIYYLGFLQGVSEKQ